MLKAVWQALRAQGDVLQLERRAGVGHRDDELAPRRLFLRERDRTRNIASQWLERVLEETTGERH